MTSRQEARAKDAHEKELKRRREREGRFELTSLAVVVAVAYFTGALAVGQDVLAAVWHYFYDSDSFVDWTPLVWTLSAAAVAVVGICLLLVLLAVAWLIRQPFQRREAAALPEEDGGKG
jgi:ABC-type anion transport system duplicated permease subunit